MNKVISTTCTRCRQDIRHCDCDKPKPKRKPLPDGSLELTKEELEEFRSMIDVPVLISVIKKGSYIWVKAQDSEAYKPYQITINSYKPILYLANLFDLEV